MCCGMGGTYSLKLPEISAPILERKLVNIKNSGAPTVVMDCPGCVMQIAAGSTSRTHRSSRAHSPASGGRVGSDLVVSGEINGANDCGRTTSRAALFGRNQIPTCYSIDASRILVRPITSSPTLPMPAFIAHPEAVIQAEGMEEIRSLFAFSERAHPHDLPAAGTSLSGQSLSDACWSTSPALRTLK